MYMTIYLRQFIPGHVEYVQILKDAIIYWEMTGDEKSKSELAGRRGKPITVAVGIKWGEEQERSFEELKRAVIDNVVYGRDDTQQYYLMRDASKNGLGGVLFELLGVPAETMFTTFMRRKMKIIILISKRFLPVETCYSTTASQALAILCCLEEVRWLLFGSPFSTNDYTDHLALM